MAVIGTFILAFGRFGFNPGSTLAGTDLRIAVVATNTTPASATGAIVATLWVWKVRGNKPDPSMMCNGMLAGLVVIMAPCAFVNSVSACIIGVIAGVLVVEAAFFIERKMKVDDPVSAIAVHGVNGAWGVLSIGIFADGTYGDGWNGVPGTVTGLLYGNSTQIIAQSIGVIANVVYIGVVSVIVYKLIDPVIGNRVPAAAEVEGLDLPEMGIPGYRRRGRCEAEQVRLTCCIHGLTSPAAPTLRKRSVCLIGTSSPPRRRGIDAFHDSSNSFTPSMTARSQTAPTIPTQNSNPGFFPSSFPIPSWYKSDERHETD